MQPQRTGAMAFAYAFVERFDQLSSGANDLFFVAAATLIEGVGE